MSGGLTGSVALADAVAQLQRNKTPDAATDARILLAAALGISRTQLITCLHAPLTAAQSDEFARMLAARLAHQPVSQIIGWREFWSRRFIVTPDVLDPRPDSETLIAAALEQGFSRVLDLGTGSGALVITLLAEQPGATGLGVDISDAALKVAARNAKALGVSDRLELKQSDWLEEVTGQYDLIICNPPYISADDWAGLAPDLRLHEPRFALTPGGDGLSVYQHLARTLAPYLAPNGRVIFEIGHQQGQDVVEIMTAAGWPMAELIQDINNHDRVVVLKIPTK